MSWSDSSATAGGGRRGRRAEVKAEEVKEEVKDLLDKDEELVEGTRGCVDTVRSERMTRRYIRV